MNGRRQAVAWIRRFQLAVSIAAPAVTGAQVFQPGYFTERSASFGSNGSEVANSQTPLTVGPGPLFLSGSTSVTDLTLTPPFVSSPPPLGTGTMNYLAVSEGTYGLGTSVEVAGNLPAGSYFDAFFRAGVQDYIQVTAPQDADPDSYRFNFRLKGRLSSNAPFGGVPMFGPTVLPFLFEVDLTIKGASTYSNGVPLFIGQPVPDGDFDVLLPFLMPFSVFSGGLDQFTLSMTTLFGVDAPSFDVDVDVLADMAHTLTLESVQALAKNGTDITSQVKLGSVLEGTAVVSSTPEPGVASLLVIPVLGALLLERRRRRQTAQRPR